LSEQIIEIKPSGISGGTIVWEWHLWDHLVQDYDASKPTHYGTIAASSKLINVNRNVQANQD
jgi:hypothetical protein